MSDSTEKIKQGILWQIRKTINYFFKGLLISLPLIITYRVVKSLVIWLDTFLELDTPGLGTLIVLVSITFIGIIGSSFITRPIIDILDDIFCNIPFIKIIYTSVKDLIEAFVGEKKKFSIPVFVQFMPGIYKPGFITQESCDDLIDAPNLVAVYLPHSYAFSGNLFLVERNKITEYKGSTTDFMKFIVSGAVTKIDGENHA